MADAVTKLRQPKATFGENRAIEKMYIYLKFVFVRTDVKIWFISISFYSLISFSY